MPKALFISYAKLSISIFIISLNSHKFYRFAYLEKKKVYQGREIGVYGKEVYRK